MGFIACASTAILTRQMGGRQWIALTEIKNSVIISRPVAKDRSWTVPSVSRPA
jgi:hypothetical protein